MAKANINQKVKSRKSLACLSAFVESAIRQPTTDNQQPSTNPSIQKQQKIFVPSNGKKFKKPRSSLKGLFVLFLFHKNNTP
jgi:hypothetical protein